MYVFTRSGDTMCLIAWLVKHFWTDTVVIVGESGYFG